MTDPCLLCGGYWPGDCPHLPLYVLGAALLGEDLRDTGRVLPEDECVSPLLMHVAWVGAMMVDEPPLHLRCHLADALAVSAAALAHPLYPRLKARSAREVLGCDRPETCRHGLVRRALLSVERMYFTALEADRA